ncbi:PAS domain S-box protein [Azonexus sp.]|uniref:PAS domain-containing sensor histidine kinase n=1 Tax=Azonexus sp. TaxID=1872668 RepID=UPI0027BAE9BF|nr:PAS domain S-box protein [Azonexus sp.]
MPSQPAASDSTASVRIRQLEAENDMLRQSLARHRSESSRPEQERSLRAILDQMPAMVGYWDKEQRNQFGNRAYIEWFGIDPANMKDKHIQEIIGEERYRLNLPFIEAALRGERQEFERAIPTPDGSRVRHALASYIPDFEHDEVCGFFVLVTDISAIKEAETRLRHSEERYRAVVDDQTELISRFKRDGTFLFVNDVYCRFFGKTPEDLIGQQWMPACHAADLEYVEIQLQTLSPENPLVTIENRVYSTSGEVHWMQFVNRGFFDEQGQLVEIQSVGRDVCKRKKAEAALHEAHEKLEQRVVERTSQLRRLVVDSTLAEERERQALARDLHDGLGQLLHVIRLKVDALETSLSPTAQAGIAELQTLLTDGSRQVRSLTTQLSPPVLRKLGLTAALHWLCDEMTNQYGLQVDFEHDEDIPAVNPVIAEILFRAARELLINVARHAGTRWASLKFVHYENQLWLSVLDNGIGTDKLNESLEQTDGFGLASLRERIAYIGGNTKINAAPNQGLYVIINLPLNSLINIPEAR